MIKQVVFLLTIMSSTLIWATPHNVEVWFLTMEKQAALNEVLKRINPEMTYSNLLALTDCIPMGDGCFHPQNGFVEDKPAKKDKKKEKAVFAKPKTINASDVDLIKCDKNNYFDIYCGKAQKIKKGKTHFELWIDVSASLKQYDYSKEAGQCKRRMFLTAVKQGCSNANVSVFNTSIKELGSDQSVCENYGMNDTKRLIRWIENTHAKNLLIITDIDELNMEFGQYLSSIGASIKGDGPEGFTATDLVNSVKKAISFCKK